MVPSAHILFFNFNFFYYLKPFFIFCIVSYAMPLLRTIKNINKQQQLGVSSVPKQDGRFLHLSGMSYVYDPEKERENIQNITSTDVVVFYVVVNINLDCILSFY